MPDLRGDGAAARERARALPRPRRRRARRGAARADRRHVPARGRPPRRRAVPRPRARPAPRSRPGSSSSATVARRSWRGRASSWSGSARERRCWCTTFWCELAWLGGERAEAGVLIEVDGDRIAAVDRAGSHAAGRRRAPARAHAARARQRPLARLPARAARPHARRRSGSFWTWREQMYALAERARPRRATSRSPAPRSPRWRWPGITLRRRVPLPPPRARRHALRDPNAMGRAVIAAAARGRASGSRCSTRATCTAASASGSTRPARFADGDADAWVERVDALGRAPRRARRRGDPQRARGRPGRRRAVVADWAAARRAAARARLRAAGRERGLPRRLRRARRPRCSPTPARSADASPPCTPRTSPTTTSRCSAARARRAASARPPSATSPTASARRAGCATPARALAVGTDSHAVIDLFEEARAIELDERLATRRARHHTARRDLLARRHAPAATPRLGWPEGGRIDAGRARRPHHRRARLACGWRAPSAEHAAAAAVFAATAADVRARDRRRARGSCATGAHVTLDVAARAGASAQPGGLSTSSRRRQHRAARHQRPGARRGAARARRATPRS